MNLFLHIKDAPKNGDEILAVCSDGVTRYCRWVGCSESEGYWEARQECTPLRFDPTKTLPHDRDGERLAYLIHSDSAPDYLRHVKRDRHELAFECMEARGEARVFPEQRDELNGFRKMIDEAIKADPFDAFKYLLGSL